MRPKTLAEVAQDVAAGESFNISLFNFLDEFYRAPKAAALAPTPPLLAEKLGEKGKIEDAYLAAVAEHLGQQFALEIPFWTTAEARKLHRPWFACTLASVRAVLILESPPAFRSRNLFVSENALSRA